MAQRLRHIMASGRIGSMELRNRIVMSPMGSNLAEEDGFCGEAIQRYYEARAKGGAAMVIMGSVGIAYPKGSPNWRQVAISHDKYMPGLTKLAEAVHAHGAKVAAQLHHGGLEAMNDCSVGRPMLCPSVPEPGVNGLSGYLSEYEQGKMAEAFMTETCKIDHQVATDEDITWLIGKFAEAADRAKRCGFDGVELHAGHGYIISSFLNPKVNKRADQYGGSIENRSRLLEEIIQGVKQRVGQDYPVWFRLDSNQFSKEGISHEDAKVTARLAVQAGADAVHCSADGDHASPTCWTDGHTTHTPCGFLPFASAIKKMVNVPVIMPGRVEPEAGDRLIEKGEIDFVTMGRKLLADPELPNKIRDNRLKDIRPCIYCYTCISQIFLRKHVICAVNAQTGHEVERAITPAAHKKQVLVVGGGPAGMEAARVAALRGHSVTLVEKDKRLGGTVFFSGASYPPNSKLVTYLVRQVKQLPVNVQLGVDVTVDYIRRQAPDAVIVAVGAGREMPNVPGIDLPHVFSGDDMRNLITGADPDSLADKISGTTKLMLAGGAMTGITGNMALMRQLSKIWMPLGKRVVMIGGGLVAVELAEYLAERGRQVTLLDEGGLFGKELMLVRRFRNMKDIEKLGVECLPNARLVRIDDKTLTYVNAGNQERTIAADHIIVTSGTTPNTSLADQLTELHVQVLTAGDCSSVTYIEGAMHEGHKAGQTV
ncbi:MAG: FAD-dependent oxidoreductase [Pseudomonadales bacterium]